MTYLDTVFIVISYAPVWAERLELPYCPKFSGIYDAGERFVGKLKSFFCKKKH